MVILQLEAQLAFSALTAPGAAAVEEQLEAQLLEQSAFSALTAPGAAEADLQQPSVPQQAVVPPEAPGEVVLLLLQPTKVAARVTAAMVKSVRIG